MRTVLHWDVFISSLKDLPGDMQHFQQMVESTLDMDLVDRGEFLVKPSFDDDLQGVNITLNILQFTQHCYR
jgi:DNA mismatch repair protein MSH2